MKIVRSSLSCVCLLLSVLPVQAAEIGRPAAAPVEPVAMTSLLQVSLALIFVLLLIFGLAWLLRRMGGVAQSGSGLVRVLGSVAVGQRERVVLVQIGQQQLVLGVAPGSVQTLHVLTEPLAEQAGEDGDDGFAQRLHALLSKGARE